MLAPALTILSFAAVSFGKLYERVADLPTLQYDFVIVGGGTSGNALASRLTENKNIAVLVLEAGPNPGGDLNVAVPFFSNGVSANNTIYSWNYTTIPQVGANGAAYPFSRGYMLGGCSAHNGLAYTRGSAADYNRYATITGDQGWSWNSVLPYFKKSEKLVPPADNHDTTNQVTPSVHGTSGPIQVSLSGYAWTEWQGHVLQTTKELPNDFPFNQDYNSGKPLGIGYMQSTIGGGQRSSSVTGYLNSTVLARSNLHILLHAQVSKLVNPVASRVVPTQPTAFGGVQFKFGGSLYVASASKEIILSAGPIGTPNILMHSGVGDSVALKQLGITVVRDLPSVGKNASEHPYTGLNWSVNSTQTVERMFTNPDLYNSAFAQWNKSHTGPFTDAGPGTMLAWLRLPKNSTTLKAYPDPTPDSTSPHFEILFQPTGTDIYGPGPYAPAVSFTMALVSPASRGSVTLNSNDPFAAPTIDLGFFTNPFDAAALAEGLKLVTKITSAPNWKGYLVTPSLDITTLSDADLVAHVRSVSGPGYHLVGTAGMSPIGAQYGVVDPNLKVKGIYGLRVVDVSVVPIVPAAHTQAVAYVVAERAADLIKQQWNL
ncbi:pyranose dehydrogenase [Roridomyces roridus]|uniref:Pyranose dehydrogenase n=1 Tax=Roridomyces roridus TaxID=1738132 RepID=A0AAD7CCP3_9AGAR|nr:pyranose dehydrogenase [Roridomyces roridus]